MDLIFIVSVCFNTAYFQSIKNKYSESIDNTK